MVGGNAQGRIVNAGPDVRQIFEHDGWSPVSEQSGIGCCRLDDGSLRGKIAPQDGGASLGSERIVEGPDYIFVEDLRILDRFAQGDPGCGGAVQVEKVLDTVGDLMGGVKARVSA